MKRNKGKRGAKSGARGKGGAKGRRGSRIVKVNAAGTGFQDAKTPIGLPPLPEIVRQVKLKADSEKFPSYSRQQLIGMLSKIGHGDLRIYIEPGITAAKLDPEVFGRFICWNQAKGVVRDSQVAWPILALRGVGREDKELAENAIAHLVSLNPRMLLQAYRFNKQLSAAGLVISGGWRRLLEKAMKDYLRLREGNKGWWDRVALQHRESLMELYRIAHLHPSKRAQSLLFESKVPRGSVFGKLRKLGEMTPEDAASTILVEEIPLQIAMGALQKNLKNPDVVFSLIKGMTPNQLISNAKLLEKMGVGTNELLTNAYTLALEEAAKAKPKKHSPKMGVLKAGVAAGAGVSEQTQKNLQRLQQKGLEQVGGIEGDWAVLVDKSHSMQHALEAGRRIGALIAERTKGKVWLIFFNSEATPVDITGLTYEQVLAKTRAERAHGGTSVGSALRYLTNRRESVGGIVIVSDGGDNTEPKFHDQYMAHKRVMQNSGGIEDPTVYFLRLVGGEPDYMSRLCESAGIELNIRDLGSAVDYNSFPNIIQELRVRKDGLLDEIMGYELLTLNQVFTTERSER